MNQKDRFYSTSVVEPLIIASIPDLDVPASPGKHRHSSKSKTRKQAFPSGRLLSAGLSMKVLIGLGLCLIVGAIANQISNNTRSKMDNDLEQAWQPPPPAPTADLAPAWKPAIAQAEPSTDKLGDKVNTIDVEGQADFSVWPNPAHPVLAQSDPRQSETLSADRRNEIASGGSIRTSSVPAPDTGGAVLPIPENRGSAAHFEGTIDTSSDRNTYDRSRSSIH